MIRINREKVSSKSIVSAGYDAASATLELEYSGGGLYRHFMVPAELHRRLMDASSKGAFVNEHIKDRFPCERLRKSFPPMDGR
jgi:hypothetical protein